jgi:hypothetical protein
MPLELPRVYANRNAVLDHGEELGNQGTVWSTVVGAAAPAGVYRFNRLREDKSAR